MTGKALVIFAAIVVAALFSFTTFAQEQGQEGTTKNIVTYGDLVAQSKKIEGLKINYTKVNSEFTAECSGKAESMADYKKCNEKRTQLITIYNEMKKEIESYNKNVEQYKK
jgi:hypothetical protein